jgi:hypothetical protein
MTKDEAIALAQLRANRSGKTIAVYYRTEPFDLRETLQGFKFHYTTPDRPDFPDEWVVVAIVEPEEKP